MPRPIPAHGRHRSMREAFGCGFYNGPDQRHRSNKTGQGNAVWHPLPQRTGVQLHHRNTTQHEQQQPPSSYRRERHATGVDGKLPRELLGRWPMIQQPELLAEPVWKDNERPEPKHSHKFSKLEAETATSCLPEESVLFSHWTMLPEGKSKEGRSHVRTPA